MISTFSGKKIPNGYNLIFFNKLYTRSGIVSILYLPAKPNLTFYTGVTLYTFSFKNAFTSSADGIAGIPPRF